MVREETLSAMSDAAKAKSRREWEPGLERWKEKRSELSGRDKGWSAQRESEESRAMASLERVGRRGVGMGVQLKSPSAKWIG